MGGPVYDSMIHLHPADIRARIARAEYRDGTAGLAPEYVQGNLAILPGDLAADFLEFCKANPKPCPLLGYSRPGDPEIPALGSIDIRTDVPSYNIYRHGRLEGSATDIRDLWRDDFVAFILGCSLSFEAPLIRDGIRLAHVERGGIVPMYRTNIETVPAGPFGGNMVVSMRPMKPAEAIRAVEITSRFPAVHGSPVHLAEPEQIGIHDLMRPDWGDIPVMRPGDIPVFWACGVTPQVALEKAKPEICITHTPGCMLVTDLLNDSLESAGRS